MSQADWTPSPADEREARNRRLRLRRHDGLALTLGAAGIVLMVAAGSITAGMLLGGAAAFLTFLILAVVGFVLALRIDGRRDALTAEIKALDDALRDEFGPGTGWLVDLIVLAGHAPLGTDRGMLWIEGDRLLFSGRRTSFALASEQAAGPVRNRLPVRGLRHALNLRLRLGTPAGPLAISFQPVSPEPSALTSDLRAWRKSATAGGGQFPPSVPGPGFASRPRALARAVVATAYWAGVAALLVRVESLAPCLATLVGALALAAILRLWAPLASWRAWFDLGRVQGGIALDVPPEVP